MEREIKELEIQIKGMELERDRLKQAYVTGELAEDQFKQIYALNRQILKLSYKLIKLRLRDPQKYDASSPAKPNPVELMLSWCDVFGFMVLITCFCVGSSVCLRSEGIGSAILTTLSIVAIGIPGLFVEELIGTVKNRLGEVLPTYYCSESLFSGNIRRALQRIWDHITWFGAFTVFCGNLIFVGNVSCFFNPSASNLSIAGIILLSLSAFFVFGFKIVRDVRRGTRRASQVF